MLPPKTYNVSSLYLPYKYNFRSYLNLLCNNMSRLRYEKVVLVRCREPNGPNLIGIPRNRAELDLTGPHASCYMQEAREPNRKPETERFGTEPNRI